MMPVSCDALKPIAPQSFWVCMCLWGCLPLVTGVLHRRRKLKMYLVVDAGQALRHGKHHLVLFCLAHMYIASDANSSKQM